jgi:hypothetical protein
MKGRTGVVALAAVLAAAHFTSSARAQAGLGDFFHVPSGKPHRISTASPDPNSNADALQLPAGGELTLCDLKTAGTITHFWLVVESDDPYYGRTIVLRCKWDGESLPSVEVPIGDFFGVGHGLEADVNTLPIQVRSDGRARSSFWPMPFKDSALITLRNDSSRPAHVVYSQIDWVDGTSSGQNFHAYFHVSPRDPSLRQVKVAEITGHGRYVGTVLSVWSGEEGWPGEGDERFFVDASDKPALVGPCFEAAFGDAWTYHVGTGPYGGVTWFDGTGAGARSTACRFYLADPIHFDKSLAVTYERMGWATRDGVPQIATDRLDAFSSVAFWYQDEPHATLPVLPTVAERLPFYEVRVEPEEKKVLAQIEVPEGAPAPVKKEGAYWAYGAEVEFTPPTREVATLTIPFTVPRVIDYDLYVRLTKSPDAGAYRLYVDGDPLGAPVDLYAPRAVLTEKLLGRVKLKDGVTHTLQFKCVGKNLESTGFTLGVDSFMARWYSLP